MDPHAAHLLGRIAAVEFPIENVYTSAPPRTADGARAVLAGMTEELDGIVRRIDSQTEAQAREQPVAGWA